MTRDIKAQMNKLPTSSNKKTRTSEECFLSFIIQLLRKTLKKTVPNAIDTITNLIFNFIFCTLINYFLPSSFINVSISSFLRPPLSFNTASYFDFKASNVIWSDILEP